MKPAIFPEGLGLATTKDLSKNEVVLEVPKRLWINPDAVADSEIGNACSGLKPWISVALFLIRENFKEDSRWRRYLDILPQETDSTVFWWVWLGSYCLICSLLRCVFIIVELMECLS